jgi:hypothetical protein
MLFSYLSGCWLVTSPCCQILATGHFDSLSWISIRAAIRLCCSRSSLQAVCLVPVVLLTYCTNNVGHSLFFLERIAHSLFDVPFFCLPSLDLSLLPLKHVSDFLSFVSKCTKGLSRLVDSSFAFYITGHYLGEIWSRELQHRG